MNKKIIKSDSKFLIAMPGLSLIEAAIAILMVSISATTIIILQTKLSRTVFDAHSHISRLYIGKNLFVTADKNNWYSKNDTQIQKHEDPFTTLTYKASEEQKTALKNFPAITTEKVTMSWKGIFGKTQEETLLTFRFVPKGKK